MDLVADLARLLLEHADELGADDLALGLRFVDASQQVQKAVRGVHVDEVRVHLVLEDIHHLLGLALAHEAVVHVHADEVLADGLDEQRRHDRAIDATGKSQQHLAVADLLAYGLYLLVDECLGELGSVDACHGIGADVRVHAGLLAIG